MVWVIFSGGWPEESSEGHRCGGMGGGGAMGGEGQGGEKKRE